MKIKTKIIASVLIFLQACTLYGSSTTTTPTSTATKTTGLTKPQPGQDPTVVYRNEEQKMFFPASLPTSSYAETAIDTVFGSSGLNLSTTEINKIKKTYFYLEFLVKAEKANKESQYAAYKNDFIEFFQNTDHQTPHMPTSDLLETDGWKNIPVTATDIQLSEAWQNFINSLVADCYVNDYVFLEIIHQVEDQIFPYIPNIEVAYYNYDFTKLRNLAETTRIKAVLQDDLKQRYLAQSTDWKSVDHKTLGADVVAFKKTDFYQSTHNLNSWVSLKKDGDKLSGTPTTKVLTSPLREQVWAYFMLINVQGNITGMMSAENLQTVLSKASSTSLQPNFFFYESSDLVYLYDFLSLKENFDTDHASQDATATTHQKKAVTKPETLRNPEHMISNQRPNTPGAVSVQALTAKPSSKKTSTMNDFEAAETAASTVSKHVAKSNMHDNDSVIVQNIFHDLGHAFESAGKAVVKGVEDAGKAIVHGTEAAAEGVAGFGASVVGDVIYAATGNDTVRNWGHKVTQDAINNLKQAGSDLDNAVDDFATAIEDGIIAPIADVTGSLVGFILQDKKIGQDMTGIINNVADSLVNIGTTIIKSQIDVADNLAVQEFTLTEKFAEVVTDSAMAVAGVIVAGATGGKDTKLMDRSAHELSEDGKALVHDTVNAITQTFSSLLHAVESVMMSVVQCLAAITNAITTIFIDTVREITFITVGLTSLVVNAAGGHMNAKQIRDHVTNVLEAHRRTINMVTGITLAVAMTVAVTVCTGGAGAPEAAAMDAALIGGEGATEGAAIAAGEVGAEAGVTAAGEAGAETATTVASTATEAGTDAGTVSGIGQEAATGTTSATSSSSSTTATTVAETGSEVGSEAGTEAGVETGTEAGSEASSEAGTEAGSEEGVGEEGSEEGGEEGNEEENNEEKDDSSEKDSSSKKAKWTTANSIGQLLNVAFGVFNVIAGYNQDEAAIEKEEKAEESLRNLWKFIENTKVSLTQGQKLYLEELSKKHHAAVGNQALGLEYYVNFLNASTDNVEEQIALALGQEYISMLTPNSDGLQAGNIGATWGINTPFVYLYPSQGFLSTTLGRSMPFAQEIAQAPLVAQKTSSNTSSTGTVTNIPLKLWFNQRAVTVIDQAATDKLDVEIKFRVIYNLTTAFHVGLYLGGTYYNYLSPSYLKELKEKGSVDLDAAHLAKMFVVYRDSKSDPTRIGVYENEGKEWVIDETLPTDAFAHNEIYCMKATLDGTNLSVSFWPENDTSKKWTSTADVTTTDQRTFGLIFSGAAIEWDVVSPKITISPNTKARKPISNVLEATREKTSKAKWKTLMSPSFGSFTLTALGKGDLLRGQYVYTTTDTGLQTSDHKAMTDYLIFAQTASSDLSEVGMSPIASHAPSAAISLVTGNVYSSNKTVIGHRHGVWTTYNTSHGPFAPTLATAITNAQKEIIQQQMNTKIGSFDLTAVSEKMIENSQFVYTCDTTITQKTSKGKAITDYLIMAQISNNALGAKIGMPPNIMNSEGMVSLVTGNVYDSSSNTPVDSGYAELIPYEGQYGKLPSATTTKIAASKKAYLAALQAAEKKDKPTTSSSSSSKATTPSTVSLGSGGLSLSSMSSSSSPSTGGLQLGLSSAAPGLSLSTSSSLTLRQNNAAGGAGLQLGGLSGSGLSLSSSSSSSSSGGLSLASSGSSSLSLGGEVNQGLNLDSSSLSLG